VAFKLLPTTQCSINKFILHFAKKREKVGFKVFH
jgi:hypothetical protein